MNRSLASNLDAVHPVRRAFPAAAAPVRAARAPGEDARLFLMTFVAGFLAISGMIA